MKSEGQSFSKKPKSESGFSIKREEDGDDGDDFYPLDDDDGNDPNSITPSDAWIRTTLRRQAPDEKISEASKGFTDALESTAERRPEALIAQQESVRPGAEEAIQDQSDVYEVVTQPGIDSQDHPIVSFEWFQHQGQCQLPATQKRKSRDSVRYTNKYHFAFGEDKLPNHIKPTPEDMAAVSAILKEERPTLESGRVQASGRLPQVSACTPVRAGTGITVDSLVRVIMSQCCRNETALDIQQTLIRAYPYDVEGSTYFGEKPNYHAMRIESVKKLATVIKRAGLGERKSQRIKECLDMIYAKNVELLPPGDVVYESNEPGAKDFVPGLLSLDYLHDIYAQGGKQGLFDYLVSFPQIGVKSACCLMSFNMELPVFAVDTHVAAMVKLLGWVPEDCKDEATMAGHLDARMLDGDEKIQLHQDLWRHRRNCVRCSGRAKPHSPAWQNTVCPLEHLVRRHTPGGAPVEENSDLLRAEPSPEKGRTTAFKRQPVSSEEDMRPAGLVKVTYKLDDNFDTAGANITERTTWIRDFSNVAFDIDGETDEESNGEDHEQLTPGRRDLPRN